jgi:hypothetical protein
MCIVQTVAELGSRTWVFFFFKSNFDKQASLGVGRYGSLRRALGRIIL